MKRNAPDAKEALAMKFDSEELTAIAQSEGTVRWDMYATIHKALRACMCDALVAVGRMDTDDDLECAQTCQSVLGLMDFCHSHVQHENAFVHPAIEQHAPGESARAAAEHVEHQADIARIAAAATRLMGLPAALRRGEAHRLYHQLSRFVAHNFEHMLMEEHQHNAVLWAGFSDAQLQGIEDALRATIPPQEMMEDLRWMLPALSPAERAGLMRGMREEAPLPAFSAALALARQHLNATQWSKLEGALAQAS